MFILAQKYHFQTADRVTVYKETFIFQDFSQYRYLYNSNSNSRISKQVGVGVSLMFGCLLALGNLSSLQELSRRVCESQGEGWFPEQSRSSVDFRKGRISAFIISELSSSHRHT
jgi:hypothetical protein